MMNKTNLLTKDDIQLIKNVKIFLKKNYKRHRHHVACGLRADGKLYYSTHLDIKNGFDVCAEPLAINNALLEGEDDFETIVSIIRTEYVYKVINPCGNCSQLMKEYIPSVKVIVSRKGKLLKVSPNVLLPFDPS